MNPLLMTNYITCMQIIKKYNNSDEDNPNQLVVCTEGKNIFIIDNSDHKIINKMKLDSIPSSISCQGSYEGDYKIFVACRNEIVYILTSTGISQNIIQVCSHIINIIKQDIGLYVSSMNEYYSCYNINGKNLFSLKMPSPILTMEEMDIYKLKKFKGILIGLVNNEISLYNDKTLINVISIPENILGMKFGFVSKQQPTLFICSEGGSLYIKNLDLNTNFESSFQRLNNVQADDTMINIPKKTTTFLEYMEREKECYKSKYLNNSRSL